MHAVAENYEQTYTHTRGTSPAGHVFNVWRRARILAAHVVGENTSGVLRTLFVSLAGQTYLLRIYYVGQRARKRKCRNVGSANQITELLISRGKNVISMKRSARRQKCMCYIRLMHAVLTWLTHPWLTTKLESARQ